MSTASQVKNLLTLRAILQSTTSGLLNISGSRSNPAGKDFRQSLTYVSSFCNCAAMYFECIDIGGLAGAAMRIARTAHQRLLLIIVSCRVPDYYIVVFGPVPYHPDNSIIITIIMRPFLTLALTFVYSLAHALPQAALATTAVVARSAPAANPTYTVEVVTLDYIVGTSSFENVATVTDYGTVGSGVGTADLPIVTDPCGPAVQDNYTPPTCNDDGGSSSTDFNNINDLGYDPSIVIQVATPAPYGVMCLNSSTSQATIKTNNCDRTTTDICKKIQSKYSPRGKWIWSSIGGAGCAMGYWLPHYNGSAPPPDTKRCEEGIYGTMLDRCTSLEDNYFGVSNIAAVNLRRLPSTNGTGMQVNVGYPSYIIAPAPIP
ncbi:mediator of RNA polymerase II transcription subunit 12 [Physcia stellaris]|nr:mediator of RNA polymerase II transcription subunit 12 [Physcia stellaris]